MKGFFLVALLILGVSLIPLSAATSAGSGDENLSENGMGSAGVNINFDLSLRQCYSENAAHFWAS